MVSPQLPLRHYRAVLEEMLVLVRGGILKLHHLLSTLVDLTTDVGVCVREGGHVDVLLSEEHLRVRVPVRL